MEGINKKYNLEIEVLTPLSIGAGAEKDWVRGVDFVVTEGKLYKFNMRKMVQNGIKPEELSSYFASKDEKGLMAKLAGKLENVCDAIIPLPVTSVNDVKSFVKNQLTGKPILVGSSLKGAIRSILLDSIATKKEIDAAIDKAKKEHKPFESFLFGSSTKGDEFMRFMKFSDAEFEETSLVNTKIFNLRKPNNEWLGGWKHKQTDRDGNSFTNGTFDPIGFNTLYECLMPQQKGYATLMMSSSVYDLFEEKATPHILSSKKRPVLHNDVSTLFGIINEHTRVYLRKEKVFFIKYPTDRTDNIIASIDALLQQIPSDNSYCILKMSAGSGFHSITGDWQFKASYVDGRFDRKRANKEVLSEPGKVMPKSRKIAIWEDNFSLMGFVKLTALSEEAMKQVEAKRMAEKERKEQEERARLEEERKKAEAAALAQREREEREKQFLELVSEVERMVAAEQYEEALVKYDAACAAYPECKQNRVDVEELRWKVDAIVAERKQKDDEAKREQERLQSQKEKAEGGLAMALAEKYEFGPNEGQYKVTSFKVCQNKVASWMKAARVTQVPVDQQEALFETLKRLKATADKKEAKSWTDFGSGIWKQLTSLVGTETAKQWFEEMVG